VHRLRTPNSSSRLLEFNNWTYNDYNGLGLTRQSGDNYAGIFMTTARTFLIAKGSGGSRNLEVNSNGVSSVSIYNRTYTSTSQLVRVTNDGYLASSTSSRSYKLQEKVVDLEYAKKILDLDAKSWYDKIQVERHANYLTKLSSGHSTSKEDMAEESITRIGGLIAEDVHDVGLGMYVNYNADDRPEGIAQYLWTLLIPVLKDHVNTTEDNFDDLKLKHGLLKTKHELLENEVSHLKHKVENLEKLLEVSQMKLEIELKEVSNVVNFLDG